MSAANGGGSGPPDDGGRPKVRRDFDQPYRNVALNPPPPADVLPRGSFGQPPFDMLRPRVNRDFDLPPRNVAINGPVLPVLPQAARSYTYGDLVIPPAMRALRRDRESPPRSGIFGLGQATQPLRYYSRRRAQGRAIVPYDPFAVTQYETGIDSYYGNNAFIRLKANDRFPSVTQSTVDGPNGTSKTVTYAAVGGGASWLGAVTSNADAANLGVAFDGTAAFVDLTQSPTAGGGMFANNFVVSTNVSAIFIVAKKDSSATTAAELIDFVNTSGVTNRLEAAINASGKVKITVQTNATDSKTWTWASTASLHDNKKHFFALVQRADGNGWQFYLDGVLITGPTITTAGGGASISVDAGFYDYYTSANYNALAKFYVGALARVSGTNPWKGNFDSVAFIADKAPTATEITRLAATLSLG
jgi:hypothetical protein